jgi:hypothetical protein
MTVVMQLCNTPAFVALSKQQELNKALAEHGDR